MRLHALEAALAAEDSSGDGEYEPSSSSESDTSTSSSGSEGEEAVCIPSSPKTRRGRKRKTTSTDNQSPHNASPDSCSASPDSCSPPFPDSKLPAASKSSYGRASRTALNLKGIRQKALKTPQNFKSTGKRSLRTPRSLRGTGFGWNRTPQQPRASLKSRSTPCIPEKRLATKKGRKTDFEKAKERCVNPDKVWCDV